MLRYFSYGHAAKIFLIKYKVVQASQKNSIRSLPRSFRTIVRLYLLHINGIISLQVTINNLKMVHSIFLVYKCAKSFPRKLNLLLFSLNNQLIFAIQVFRRTKIILRNFRFTKIIILSK